MTPIKPDLSDRYFNSERIRRTVHCQNPDGQCSEIMGGFHGKWGATVRLFQLICCVGVLAIVTGCSENLDFRLGVVTRSISGEFIVTGESDKVQPFIIARKYNRTLIETDGGYLFRIVAELVRPENGKYHISMAAETNRIDLMFIGRRHRPLTYHFKRTLGVGEYIYDARLTEDAAWKDSYYLLIKPALTDYIIEQRFKMSRSDQLYLGEWMDRTEAEFD